MEIEERKRLVETAKGLKLNGFCCKVAGYHWETAGISPCTGGAYETSWETVKRVMESESKDFRGENIWRSRSGWLGFGCCAEWRMCQEEWYKKNREESTNVQPT